MTFRKQVMWFSAFWLLCSLLSYGIMLGDMDGRYNGIGRREAAFCLGFSLFFGPVALAIGFFSTGFVEDGLLFIPHKEQ